MTRREVLVAALLGMAVPPSRTAAQARDGASGAVQTVTGEVPAGRLGVTLMHEHVLVDFAGADRVHPGRYDAEEAFRVALPYLTKVRSLGCETLVECTPAYLGRDVRLLKRLSEASGLAILTNTGYYGAAGDKHLPAHAFSESADQLAARWIAEWEHGIEGSGIRPAFLKIGVDQAPLSDVDAKLVRAAAITWRATRLPIASHTGTGAAALAQLELLDRAQVPAQAFIWVHAHSERDGSYHVRAARSGAWVEFDGVAEDSLPRHIELVQHLARQGLLGRVLVSHDAGWYHVGEPGGGTFRGYETLFTSFLPALSRAALTAEQLRQLTVENPQAALTQGR